MNVLGGPDDRSSREHRGSMSVTQRDVTKCPSSAAVNSLFVVRPEINRGRYDTGVEFRVCTMIVLKPAAAAGVCLGAFPTTNLRHFYLVNEFLVVNDVVEDAAGGPARRLSTGCLSTRMLVGETAVVEGKVCRRRGV